MKIEGIDSKVTPTASSFKAAPVQSQTATTNVAVTSVADVKAEPQAKDYKDSKDSKDNKDPFANKEQLYEIKDVNPEKVKNAVDDINKKIKPSHNNLQFSYHEKTHRISITVKNDEGKVIKEIPPEKTLDMIAKAWELAGILVDEKR